LESCFSKAQARHHLKPIHSASKGDTEISEIFVSANRTRPAELRTTSPNLSYINIDLEETNWRGLHFGTAQTREDWQGGFAELNSSTNKEAF
jgi:hypothetical protein